MEKEITVKREMDPDTIKIQSCLICSNPIICSSNHNFNHDVLLWRFSTISCRYLNIDIERCKGLNLKPKGTLNFTDKNLKSFIKENVGDTDKDLCEDCRSVLKSFCDIYENWTYLQLQLNCRLREIKNLMQLHNSNQSKSNNTQQCKIKGARRTSWDIFKKHFIKSVGHKRNPNDFPRMKLQRQKLKEPDLSDDLFSAIRVKKSKVKSKPRSTNSSRDSRTDKNTHDVPCNITNADATTANKLDDHEIQILTENRTQIKNSSTTPPSPEISIIQKEKNQNISKESNQSNIPKTTNIFSSNDNQKKLKLFLINFVESLAKPMDNHQDVDLSSELDRPFKCSICPMTFKLELNRDRHLRGVHRFKKPESPEQEQTDKEEKSPSVISNQTETQAKTQTEDPKDENQTSVNKTVTPPPPPSSQPNPPPAATTISNEKITELWSIEYEDNEKENFDQHHHDHDDDHNEDQEFPIMDTNEAVFATKNISSPGEDLNVDPKNSTPTQSFVTVTRFHCSLCQNSYSARQSLIRHFRSAHLSKTSKIVSKQKENKNVKSKIHQKCPQCPMRFRTNTHLQAHQSCHHRRDAENPSNNGGNFQFQCSICQKHFPTVSACNRHGRFAHRGDSQFKVITMITLGQPEKSSISTSKSKSSQPRKITMKAKKCRFCPKRFPSLTARRHHENIHKQSSRSRSKVSDSDTVEEDKPPTLEIGFLGAVVKQSRQNRIRCIPCSLLFGDLHEFQYHQRCRHKTETCPNAAIQDLHKYFVCDECGKIYRNIRLLSAHKKVKHKNQRKNSIASLSPRKEITGESESDATSVAVATTATSEGMEVANVEIEDVSKNDDENLPNSEIVEEQNSENSQVPKNSVAVNNNARRKQRLTTSKDPSEDLDIFIKCSQCPTYFFEEAEKNRHEESHQKIDNQNDHEPKIEKIQKVMKDFAKAWNSFSS